MAPLDSSPESYLGGQSSRIGVALLVPSMRRNPGWRDVVALLALVRALRSERPRIVHTHAAKGGTLGRVAALCAFPARRGRPALIHTYHGHSLTGYFSSRTAGFYQRVERFLARHTDVLIAVSDEIRDELIEYFDDGMLRLTREGKPNLFIYKHQIETITELGNGATARTVTGRRLRTAKDGE